MILRRKTNKRGFTIAETIVALAVVSIVSLSAISLSLSAQNSSRAALQKQQAQFYAMDIISCYRAGGDFEDNLTFALGVVVNDRDWSDEQEISLSNGLVAKVKEEGKTLKVTVVDDEKELTSLSFTKGGA